MTILDVLGARLRGWYTDNYTAATGTWVDTLGLSTPLITPIGFGKPTASVSPSGRLCVVGNGTNTTMEGAIISGAPWTPGVGERMEMIAFARAIGTAALDQRWIDDNDSNDQLGLISTKAWRFGAQSNVTITNTGWHILMAIGRADNSVRLYLDNVLQTTVGAGPLGSEWGSIKAVGGRLSDGTKNFNGSMSTVAFAYTPTSFSAADIANTYAALNDWVNVPAVVGTAMYTPYLPAANAQMQLRAGEIASLRALAGQSATNADIIFDICPVSGVPTLRSTITPGTTLTTAFLGPLCASCLALQVANPALFALIVGQDHARRWIYTTLT